jgi:PIN domain nuclease of toxin-antitoxin system
VTAPLVWTPAARPTYAGPLLLDTHLWVWMLDPAVGTLPPGLVPLIRRAAASSMLWVSDISFWEVAQKVTKGRLALTVPVATWLAKAAAAPGVQYLPVDRDVLVLSTQLSEMHGDPADRMLVAATKLRGVPLATADAAIVEWAVREGKTHLCDCR